MVYQPAESFAMLCDLWSKTRQADKPAFYVQLSKQFQALAKQFRLLPTEKPGATPTTRHEDKEEFEF